jgi:hypothetical protein
MIVAFVGFSRIFLLGILIFKGLTARRLYKSFGFKGLIKWGINFSFTEMKKMFVLKIYAVSPGTLTGRVTLGKWNRTERLW